MKVFRKKNRYGKERLYVQFVCYPVIYGESVDYFVSGFYYNTEYRCCVVDVLSHYTKAADVQILSLVRLIII